MLGTEQLADGVITQSRWSRSCRYVNGSTE
jgi:hypothetical protein